MNKKNGLIVFKESIIKKIKNFFCRLLKNNKVESKESDNNEEIEEITEEITEEMKLHQININEIFEDECKIDSRFNTLEEEIQYKREKEDFMIMYENIKNGKCNIENLLFEDVIKVLFLLNKEKEIIS